MHDDGENDRGILEWIYSSVSVDSSIFDIWTSVVLFGKEASQSRENHEKDWGRSLCFRLASVTGNYAMMISPMAKSKNPLVDSV